MLKRVSTMEAEMTEGGPWKFTPQMVKDRCVAGWFQGSKVKGRKMIGAVPLWTARSVSVYTDGCWNVVECTKNVEKDYDLQEETKCLVTYELAKTFWEERDLADVEDEWTTLSTGDRQTLLQEIDAKMSHSFA